MQRFLKNGSAVWPQNKSTGNGNGKTHSCTEGVVKDWNNSSEQSEVSPCFYVAPHPSCLIQNLVVYFQL